jgi:hypothetical protein
MLFSASAKNFGRFIFKPFESIVEIHKVVTDNAICRGLQYREVFFASDEISAS